MIDPYYGELIAEWAKVYEGTDAEAVVRQMLPVGDQLSVALREAAQRIELLEDQLKALATVQESAVADPEIPL